jgi:hypothetical protein
MFQRLDLKRTLLSYLIDLFKSEVFVVVCGDGDLTQGFLHARQVL